MKPVRFKFELFLGSILEKKSLSVICFVRRHFDLIIAVDCGFLPFKEVQCTKALSIRFSFLISVFPCRRGITPPHRVKSISMATFTTEEIDSIRNKGNDYCRKVWLGLHEGTPPVFSDEQQVRDFMLEKYERKR